MSEETPAARRSYKRPAVRRLIDFLTNMDARAWRSLAVSFVLFGGVGTLLLLGAPELGLNQAGVQRWLTLAHGPWALPAAVAAFAALAFLGAPQFVLIAAAVVVFGPWTGSLYSWIGTLVSAQIGFELGRAFGGGLIQIALLALAAALWLGSALLARRWLKAREAAAARLVEEP